jgi:serine/threonine protein kinase
MISEEAATVVYWAPEIFRHDLHDEGADIWAVGVILIILLTGNVPFGKEDDRLLRQRVLSRQFLSFPHFASSQVKDLINRMLVRRGGERFSYS